MHYITEYNTDWPRRFRQFESTLLPCLPAGCALHHVGSTSIPGMPAKDIIDMDIECPAGAMSSVIQALVKAGYEHQGDLGILTREAFRALPGSVFGALPEHHLYACESDSPELYRHQVFRQYLITHGGRALWLAEQKRLADKTAESRDGYIQNKSDAYGVITREALAWADGGAWKMQRY